MLTNIVVAEPTGTTTHLELPLDHRIYSSRYEVREVEGLGPVKSNILLQNIASMPGGKFQHAREDPRNIVLRLGFAPWSSDGQTVAELRRELTRVFTPGRQLQLRFESTHMETVRIFGYVETHEPAIFSQDPEVVISILCPDPFFESYTNVSTTLSSSNSTVVYEGDVPVGFSVEYRPTVSLSRVSLTKSLESMIYNGTVPASGYLNINTRRGAKQVFSSASGGARWLAPGSVWMELTPGNNTFSTTTTPSTTWSQRTIIIRHRPLYAGV